MLPIMIASTVENMSNPLHQVIAGQLPLITFILPFGVSVVALIVSAYYTHINRTRTSRSEQIKTSRDLWERINEKYDPIRENAKTKGWPKDKSGYIAVPTHMVWSLIREIDNFAYLILLDEIKDEVVLRYYKTYLPQYIEAILKYYTPPDRRYQVYEEYVYFNKLITKWKINRPDEEG